MKNTFILFLATLLLSPFAHANSQAEELIKAAVEVRELAYCPYSKFKVGAALLTEDGEIYRGCNVENASYGATCCAERTAVFKAVSEGQRNIEAMAICVLNGGFPCGPCRQVMNEFNPEMKLYVSNEKGELVYEGTLDEILPYSFGPKNLGK